MGSWRLGARGPSDKELCLTKRLSAWSPSPGSSRMRAPVSVFVYVQAVDWYAGRRHGPPLLDGDHVMVKGKEAERRW